MIVYNVTPHQLLMVSIAVVAVGFTLWLAWRVFLFVQHRRRNNPRALFRELCHAHALDSAGRKLLIDLAKSHDLRHAAQLFLEPARFETQKLGAPWQAREREVAAVREKLFQPGNG